MTFAVDDHVFAISDHVRSSIPVPRAFRLLGTPRLETLYHGLDPVAAAAWPSGEGVRSELGIPAGAPIVGHVGNFRTLKGHRFLLEAAVIVRREFPEARFVLLGQGRVEAEIRHHAQQLGLNGSVVFAGWREDAPRVVGAFDVFVLPSIYEGLSYSNGVIVGSGSRKSTTLIAYWASRRAISSLLFATLIVDHSAVKPGGGVNRVVLLLTAV